MGNTSAPGNVSGTPAGEPSYLASEAGKLLQGDSMKDLSQLRKALERLNSDKLSQLQKMLEERIKQLPEQAGKLEPLGGNMDQILPALLEYQKQLSREAREDRKFSGLGNELSTAGKASELSGADKAIQDTKDAADSKWNNLGGLANGDIEQLLMLVMMQASKEAAEDLKAILEEVQKLNKRKASLRRAAAVGAGAGLLLLIGVIFGPRFFPPADAASDPPEVNANLPAVQVPGSNATGPIGAAPGCKIALTSPASAVDLPISGPVNVQWTSDPPGASYALEVQAPAGEPWVIPTDGTSKNIFMENFPAGGVYEITVSTLDANGAVLCSVVVHFEKQAYDAARAKNDEGGGTYCDPNGMIGC